MKIFIDFDDVIFNTGLFKADFSAMLISNGVPKEIFENFYQDPNDKRAIKTFDPWRNIELINQKVDVDAVFLKKMVDEFIEDISRYVFKDVVAFANHVGKENICIVSFGDLNFQSIKIENSGIKKYIPNVVVTDNSKAQAIAQIISQEKLHEDMFFLDDRLEQIREIKSALPEIKTVLVKRPEGRYQEMIKEECCDFEAHDLEEVLKIINNYF